MKFKSIKPIMFFGIFLVISSIFSSSPTVSILAETRHKTDLSAHLTEAPSTSLLTTSIQLPADLLDRTAPITAGTFSDTLTASNMNDYFLLTLNANDFIRIAAEITVFDSPVPPTSSAAYIKGYIYFYGRGTPVRLDYDNLGDHIELNAIAELPGEYILHFVNNQGIQLSYEFTVIINDSNNDNFDGAELLGIQQYGALNDIDRSDYYKFYYQNHTELLDERRFAVFSMKSIQIFSYGAEMTWQVYDADRNIVLEASDSFKTFVDVPMGLGKEGWYYLRVQSMSPGLCPYEIETIVDDQEVFYGTAQKLHANPISPSTRQLALLPNSDNYFRIYLKCDELVQFNLDYCFGLALFDSSETPLIEEELQKGTTGIRLTYTPVKSGWYYLLVTSISNWAQIKVSVLNPPEIIYPSGEEVISFNPLPLHWTPSLGKLVTYDVSYRSPGERNWHTIAHNIPEPYYIWDISALDSGNYLIRVDVRTFDQLTIYGIQAEPFTLLLPCKILDTSVTPSPPQPGQPINVYAHLSHPSNRITALLSYRVNSASWLNITLTPAKENGWVAGSIGPFKTGDVIEYQAILIHYNGVVADLTPVYRIHIFIGVETSEAAISTPQLGSETVTGTGMSELALTPLGIVMGLLTPFIFLFKTWYTQKRNA